MPRKNTINESDKKEKEKSKGQNLCVSKNLLDHREQIDSIMLSIKPSLFGMLFKRFTAVMIKEYIKSLREIEALKL